MNAEPQNIEQANFEGRGRHFGVLLFVIQPFFSGSEKGNREHRRTFVRAGLSSSLIQCCWGLH